MTQVRTLVADTSPAIRSSLSLWLPHLDINEAQTTTDAIDLAKNQNFDLVIIDLSLEDYRGALAIERFAKINPRPFILVLTDRDDNESLESALRAGANSYCTKNNIQYLEFAVSVTLKDECFIDPKVSRFVVNNYTESAKYHLSALERQILASIASGATNSEMAKQHKVSLSSIKKLVAKILKKMNCNRREEAVAEGFRSGLLM